MVKDTEKALVDQMDNLPAREKDNALYFTEGEDEQVGGGMAGRGHYLTWPVGAVAAAGWCVPKLRNTGEGEMEGRWGKGESLIVNPKQTSKSKIPP